MMKPMSRMTRKPRMFGTKPKKLSRACWTLSPTLMAARGMDVPPDEARGWMWPAQVPPGKGGASRGRPGSTQPFPIRHLWEPLSRFSPDPDDDRASPDLRLDAHRRDQSTHGRLP